MRWALTSWFDIGGFLKRLLLGANHVGQEALIRFYLLHVMVLPLVDGGLVGRALLADSQRRRADSAG